MGNSSDDCVTTTLGELQSLTGATSGGTATTPATATAAAKLLVAPSSSSSSSPIDSRHGYISSTTTTSSSGTIMTTPPPHFHHHSRHDGLSVLGHYQEDTTTKEACLSPPAVKKDTRQERVKNCSWLPFQSLEEEEESLLLLPTSDTAATGAQQQQQQPQQPCCHTNQSDVTTSKSNRSDNNYYKLSTISYQNHHDSCYSYPTINTTLLQNHHQSTGTQTMTLNTRIQMERSKNYAFFSLVEDFDCTLVHIQRSFAPTFCLGLPMILRWIWCHVTYRILIMDHREALANHKMCNLLYFGHLTNVTLVMTWIYQCLSAFLSTLAWCRPKTCIFRPVQCQYRHRHQHRHRHHDCHHDCHHDQYQPSAIVCLTWCLYSISLPAEILVAIGYWAFEYDPEEKMTCINFYKHGIIACLLLVDGNIIGRIPLRIKHWKGVFLYGILYLIWSMVVSYLKLGRKHGIIYSFIDWRDDPEKAAGIGFFLLFLLGPLVFGACWLSSLSDGMNCCCCCCCCCSCRCCCCTFNGGRRRVVMYNRNNKNRAGVDCTSGYGGRMEEWEWKQEQEQQEKTSNA